MLSPTQLDRLAELAGECRHPEWEIEDGKNYTCPKCGEHILTDDPADLPTVGPYAYGITLEKLFGIIDKHDHWSVTIRRSQGVYHVTIAWVFRCVGVETYGRGELEEALAEAILKAAE